ncbi:MAG: Asp23/Gls24 family envelope stress response protein [Defluviitaleaceae bacterium]|nr:Asp23/Gls24 family envelope stress response protein [Defluviitaleaceae bacterium]
MSCKIKTTHGIIRIENEVVARIAGMAAIGCYGIVGMAAKSVKDGIVHLLKIESLTKGVKLAANEKSINIDLHVIVEYGTNITAICESIMSTVKYRVEESCGLAIGRVNVFVEGMRVDG